MIDMTEYYFSLLMLLSSSTAPLAITILVAYLVFKYEQKNQIENKINHSKIDISENIIDLSIVMEGHNFQHNLAYDTSKEENHLDNNLKLLKKLLSRTFTYNIPHPPTKTSTELDRTLHHEEILPIILFSLQKIKEEITPDDPKISESLTFGEITFGENRDPSQKFPFGNNERLIWSKKFEEGAYLARKILRFIKFENIDQLFIAAKGCNKNNFF